VDPKFQAVIVSATEANMSTHFRHGAARKGKEIRFAPRGLH
jgi:hypothetical protein